MRTLGKINVRVSWFDEARTILHFVATGPRRGHRAGFYVRLEDLLDEMKRLGIRERARILFDEAADPPPRA